MDTAVEWKVSGLYFEACNCDSVCPCYIGQAPTYGYCEGNCAWHIRKGYYGDVPLDGLNVIMVQRCDGHMRETRWNCWFYMDDRTSEAQFEALKQIFTAVNGGYLGKVYGNRWQVQSVKQAQIEVKLEGWQHRASILGRLGLAIGLLKSEAGPTLCRIPNTPGVAAMAEEDWFHEGSMNFDYRGQNALSTTFEYHSD
ncbi:MAG: DUF1326 domain-containing protein [Chloroflexi bacterium]|nr:DUF1326 domain-containing protein [Chloroflexota bacterium]MCI0575279.1 DUF1326 domain-containing protein [Chloroflexota bacterium]MCI0645725.1 DUF1326 domain-containing protein [Chloroflexota bacterium]MCI0730130.1 DUF1326 domain-containing protein [Chloroflexota bacterium]